MKKKFILIIIVGLIGTLVIYYMTINKSSKSLLSLGDSLASGQTDYNYEGYNYNDYLCSELKSKNYSNCYLDYNNKDLDSFELLVEIINNKVDSNDIPIQQLIAKSDLIVIAIGMSELGKESLQNNLTDNVINDYLSNINEILKQIRLISSKKIVLLGLYQAYNITDSQLVIINEKLSLLAQNNNTSFIDIDSIIDYENHFDNKDSNYLNYQGHKAIFEKIMTTI